MPFKCQVAFKKIIVGNIELPPTAINILFPAMEGKVTTIDVSRIVFPPEDVMECYEIIATLIGRNHTLKELTWSQIRFLSDDHADLMVESIKANGSIKHVTMESCFDQNGVNGCRALASLMTSGRSFESLHFGHNGLSGIDDVANALAANPQLGTLYITDNRLNDRDAELIAQALKQNTNLRWLNMGRGTNFTAAGFEKMSEALFDPSSLNAMEACNHTCYVGCVERNDHYAGGNFLGKTPQQRRRGKLYNMLSARHVAGSFARLLNAELGESGIIKLVPRVLERIQQCLGDRSADSPSPLSLLFELMKSQKLPELYEHRRDKENHPGERQQLRKHAFCSVSTGRVGDTSEQTEGVKESSGRGSQRTEKDSRPPLREIKVGSSKARQPVQLPSAPPKIPKRRIDSCPPSTGDTPPNCCLGTWNPIQSAAPARPRGEGKRGYVLL